jgi:hypothetical protein
MTEGGPRIFALPGMVAPSVRSALGTIRRAPLRSAILLQGVLWASVLGILPPAVIRGSREACISRQRELGSDRILIQDGDPGGPGWTWSTALIVRSIERPEIRKVTCFARRDPFLETDAASAGDCDRRLVAGRWFSPEEIRSGKGVCQVSARIAGESFPGRPAIDETIPGPEGRGNLRVIGVFEVDRDRTRLDAFGYEKDHPLYRLLSSTLTFLGVFPSDIEWIHDDGLIVVPPPLEPGSRLDLIEVRADPTRLGPVIRTLRQELIGVGQQPLLSANLMTLAVFSGSMETVDRFLRIVFVMCLGAGTIVVTCLLVLSMLDRRREIAIRRVEGATTWAIAVQFIIENGTLCLAGGLLGIPVAMGLAALRTALDPSGAVRWIFPMAETLQTIGTVTAFGLAGGLIPALKAARIQPAEVLAHE